MRKYLEGLQAASTAVEHAAHEVVPRHREAGILTWALLHRIASEVLAEVAATGAHDRQILGMLRIPEEMPYPKDDRPTCFDGHTLLPTVFIAIEAAWRRVH